MQKALLLIMMLVVLAETGFSQQKLNKSGITYLVAPKTNNLVYHDSVFRGSSEFKHLFLRTGDSRLTGLLDKHQTNKIIGQVAGVIGAVGVIVGINQLSSDKGLGWAMIGGGFAASVAGGYFTLCSQRNLTMAVSLFNQQYSRAVADIGVGNRSVGLVYKF